MFRSNYRPGLRPLPGTRALIERFLADGLGLAVASSAQRDELVHLPTGGGQPELTLRRSSRVPKGAPRVDASAGGPSSVIKDHLAGGASRLAALLIAHLCPISSHFAPCQTGAALRDLVLAHRGRATSRTF